MSTQSPKQKRRPNTTPATRLIRAVDRLIAAAKDAETARRDLMRECRRNA